MGDLRVLGEVVDPISDELSIGSHFGDRKRSTRELLAYKFILTNPRARVLYHESRQFDLSFAFAQFLWNIAGSNELHAIAFYNGKGIDFSDDGTTINGSSYGKRLFKNPIGYSQIDSIIQKLKVDPTSRRTFAAIFQPADNIVMTRDVPCPIGVQYLLRNNKLNAITFMRSNSAAFVLPYNVFFFTMMQELIACELNVELGDYIHVCSSLHYYHDEEQLVEKVLSTKPPGMRAMERMPRCTSIEYLQRLVSFDRELRASIAQDNNIRPDYWIDQANEFDPYWRQVLYVLLCHALKKTGQLDGLSSLTYLLNPTYKSLVEKVELTH